MVILKVYIGEVVGKLQGGEDRLDPPDRVGRYATEVVIFIKTSEAFVPELPDNHGIVYGATVRLSSRTVCWECAGTGFAGMDSGPSPE